MIELSRPSREQRGPILLQWLALHKETKDIRLSCFMFLYKIEGEKYIRE